MAENRKILIVDDEKEIRKSSAEILTSEGYEAETAADGTEALAKAGDSEYALAFVDLVLPGPMNGFDTIVKIRKALKDSYIIAFTGFNGQHLRKKAISAGADDFMTKPMFSEKLLQKVQDVIGKPEGQPQKQKKAEPEKTKAAPADKSAAKKQTEKQKWPLIFLNMPKEKIEELLKQSRRVELQKGETIEVDILKEMLVVYDGALSLTYGPLALGQLKTGDSIGESCLFDLQGVKSQYLLKASEKSRLFVVSQKLLQAFLAKHQLYNQYYKNAALGLSKKYCTAADNMARLLNKNIVPLN
ncbi:MAG: response regulator [candidate division KSB1 bacterium]|nr:response regulator [candidate division KSB1 bacterium]